MNRVFLIFAGSVCVLRISLVDSIVLVIRNFWQHSRQKDSIPLSERLRKSHQQTTIKNKHSKQGRKSTIITPHYRRQILIKEKHSRFAILCRYGRNPRPIYNNYRCGAYRVTWLDNHKSSTLRLSRSLQQHERPKGQNHLPHEQGPPIGSS